MATIYRPATLDERFFGHTTIVNVPVSIPPENLPKASAAPIDACPMTPNFILSNNKDSITFSEFGTFMSKYWGYFLVGAVIAGSVYWYAKSKKKNQRKRTHSTPAD